MPRMARWLVGLGALAVLGVFVFPLWRVTLEAPQYPEGIGMLIHVDGVSGVEEHDLDNINGLNHYIGMQRIEPEAIPELRLMPWIAGLIVISGLLVAWRGSRGLYVGWATVVLATLGAGVYDFWRWEYDYGHDLDPAAAIRIPGLSYQPPLFGSKQILNFVAHSYPAAGGWLLILAGTVFGLVLVYLLFAPSPQIVRTESARRATLASVATLLIGTTMLASCAGSGPRLLVLGSDECAQCRMMITDARFGGEVITRTGKVQVFDAVECLAAYVASADPALIRSVWVSNFAHPGEWIEASTARFIIGASIGSPMGRSLLALDAGVPAEAAQRRYGGRLIGWSEMLRAARSPAASGAANAATPAGY